MASERQSKLNQVRQRAEGELFFFAQLMNPTRIYGEIHKQVFEFLSKKDAKPNQLLLLPRGHQKSHCLAVWCAWHITNHPETTILYASSTERLAIKQIYAIQQIIESPDYQQLWPEMVHPDQGKREKWAAKEFIVDHPVRKQLGVRDSTVSVGSVGSNTTGLHCDVLVFDDLVTPDNAYTAIGRETVEDAYSMFSSVLNPGGMTKAAGTRYFPSDIYSQMVQEIIPTFDDSGDISGEESIWEIMEEVVEDKGDGHGKFLWPRSQHAVTKRFEGFDQKILAGIKAKYKNPWQYYSQYYNDPNDPESARLSTDKFQYYDKENLRWHDGHWHYKTNRLNLAAAADFAYTDKEKSDFSAIVVAGIDEDGFIYILDMEMYKSQKWEDHYLKIQTLSQRWGLKRIKVESNAGANIIINAVQDKIRENGGRIVVDAKYVASSEGSKKERIAAALEPKYETKSVWHYRGSFTRDLEEQLIQARPAHDDLKDALASCVEVLRPPHRQKDTSNVLTFATHGRFGGRVW